MMRFASPATSKRVQAPLAQAKNDNMAAADYPIHVILHGQKGMPPLKGVLDDAQIAEVVNYIRSEFNGFNDDPATKEQVAAARN